MLKNLIGDKIQVFDKVGSWEEAIELASQPLLNLNHIEARYITAMIDNVKKYGPYIILAPNVAMPHSRPEDGALATSMSLLKLNNPVEFPNGEGVSVFFVLSAKDASLHIDSMTELAALLEDEDKMQIIFDAKAADEIKEVLI